MRVAFLAALLSLAPSLGLAQEDPPTDEFSALTFYPATGLGNYIGVESPLIERAEIPPFGAYLDFAYRPLYILTQCDAWARLPCDVSGDRAALVETTFAIDLVGAIPIGDRIQVGLVIPIAYSSGDALVYDMAPPPFPGGSGLGIVDPRVDFKLRVYGSREEGFAFGGVLFATIPIGQLFENRFLGDELPRGGGHLIAELYADRFRIAAGLGGYFRNNAAVVASTIGPMLSYQAAAEYRFSRLVSAMAEVRGATAFLQTIDQLEIDLAVRLFAGEVQISLGGGPGIIYGPGVPRFRFFAGITYAAEADPDTDGDGVLDELDMCPARDEDQDGFRDDDGCPERDNDEDGIPDGDDGCADAAEDLDEHEDDDGCPEEDNDGDGVRDGYDSCPDTPEDRDGERDTDGCPDADADGDGVDDSRDRCPDESEDTDGLEDGDGCPDTDVDEDRIRDDQDECPEHAEDRDGTQDRDGCPEPGGRINASPPPEPAPEREETD